MPDSNVNDQKYVLTGIPALNECGGSEKEKLHRASWVRSRWTQAKGSFQDGAFRFYNWKYAVCRKVSKKGWNYNEFWLYTMWVTAESFTSKDFEKPWPPVQQQFGEQFDGRLAFANYPLDTFRNGAGSVIVRTRAYHLWSKVTCLRKGRKFSDEEVSPASLQKCRKFLAPSQTIQHLCWPPICYPYEKLS